MMWSLWYNMSQSNEKWYIKWSDNCRAFPNASFDCVHKIRLCNMYCSTRFAGGLKDTSEKHILHTSWTDGGRCAISGIFCSMVTLYIIWNGERKVHTCPSPNKTSNTAPRVPQTSCSGAWYPGLPASIVLVPPMLLVPDIIRDRPKSPRKTFHDSFSI